MAAMNLFECSLAEMKSLPQVGERTALQLEELRVAAKKEGRNITVEELEALNGNVEWQKFVSEGTISVSLPENVSIQKSLQAILDRLDSMDMFRKSADAARRKADSHIDKLYADNIAMHKRLTEVKEIVKESSEKQEQSITDLRSLVNEHFEATEVLAQKQQDRVATWEKKLEDRAEISRTTSGLLDDKIERLRGKLNSVEDLEQRQKAVEEFADTRCGRLEAAWNMVRVLNVLPPMQPPPNMPPPQMQSHVSPWIQTQSLVPEIMSTLQGPPMQSDKPLECPKQNGQTKQSQGSDHGSGEQLIKTESDQGKGQGPVVTSPIDNKQPTIEDPGYQPTDQGIHSLVPRIRPGRPEVQDMDYDKSTPTPIPQNQDYIKTPPPPPRPQGPNDGRDFYPPPPPPSGYQHGQNDGRDYNPQPPLLIGYHQGQNNGREFTYPPPPLPTNRYPQDQTYGNDYPPPLPPNPPPPARDHQNYGTEFHPQFQNFDRVAPPRDPNNGRVPTPREPHDNNRIPPNPNPNPTPQNQNRAPPPPRDPYDQGQRDRSRSPQCPRMQTFSGSPTRVKFDVFLTKFNRTATRRQWDEGKCLDRFINCLSDQALEYANRSRYNADYAQLIADMTVRFDYRDEPMAARQKLSAVKQESETEEEFVQKVQALANDGYRENRDNDLLNYLTTEAFLRGLKHKEAAMYALGRRPRTMQDALKFVKSYIANSKVIGVAKQVTFDQKAVALAPEDSYNETTNSLLRNVESLLKTHLDPKSRSPSPAPRERYPSPRYTPRDRDSNTYRAHREQRDENPNTHRTPREYERGRPRERFGRSERETYYRSPDRSRFQPRPYSPRSYPPRQYSPSPQRDSFGRRDDRAWDRREDRYRTPPRDRYNSPGWGYKGSPRQEPNTGYRQSPRQDPNTGYRQPPRRDQERGIGQSRRDYQVRAASPLPNEDQSETLNLDGLVAPANRK